MLLSCRNPLETFWISSHIFRNTVKSILIQRIDKDNLFYCSENREPVVKILGPSFATILEGEDPHSDLMRLVDKEEDQGEDKEVKVKLFLLLHDMDKQLLRELLKEISEWVLLFYLLLSTFNQIIYLSSTAMLFLSDLTRFAATSGCFWLE